MKIITVRCALVASLVLLASACLAQAQDAKPIKVPFELLKTQHIVISVKINGAGPFRVIFDTGSPVNLLNTKVAAAAGVTGKDAAENPFGALGSGAQVKMKTLEIEGLSHEREFERTVLVEVGVRKAFFMRPLVKRRNYATTCLYTSFEKVSENGGVIAEDLPCVVMNHPTVEALAKAMGPCEGIIGYPFFARYRMTIDYQAKEMTFVPTTFVPPDTLNGLQMLLLGGAKKKPATPIAPAAQFGFRVQKDDKDEQAGVNVAEVFESSPAAAAGLHAGDRLLIVDDRWTDSVLDCYTAAAGVRPGTTVRVVIRRDNAEQTLKLTLRAGV